MARLGYSGKIPATPVEVQRLAAIAAFDRSFTAAADVVGALLALSGKTELALRVRPPRRRRSRTAEKGPPPKAEPQEYNA